MIPRRPCCQWATLKGPFNVPDESFEEPTFKRLLGGEQWSLTPDGWLR